MKLYSLDNKLIELSDSIPNKFTGIAEYSDGSKQWWIDDEYIECHNNEQFLLLVSIMKLKGLA